MARAAEKRERKTDGEDERRFGRDDAPDNPTDIPKDSWPVILKRTFKQFGEDQLTTWAAALTSEISRISGRENPTST